MKESIALLEKHDAKPYRVAAMNMLVEVYTDAGRHAEALQALRDVVALNMAITTQEQEKAVAEAQEKFSTERKDREIERLSLDNPLRQAELSARTWQQRLWAAMAVGLALAAVLLVQVVRRGRTHNRELAVNNAALSHESIHDPLTGVFNRRHCQALMGQQQAMLLSRRATAITAPASAWP